MKNKTTQKELNEKLFNSVTNLDIDSVKTYINLGADCNYRDEKNDTVLYRAVHSGMVYLSSKSPKSKNCFAPAIALINNGANVNARNIEKRNILHKLAEIQDNSLKTDKAKNEVSNIFNKVVAKGEVDASDITGKTPLHIAANKGGTFITKLLIKNKADINIQDIEGNIPLYLAVKNGQVGVAKKLFDESILNIKNKSDQTLFHMAASGGKVEALNFLTKKFKNYAEYINLTDRNGKTAMHLAAENGNIEMIKALKNCKGDINARDKDGNTPLHLATIQNNTETVQTLIKLGVDSKKLNKLQQSPLQLLLENNSKIDHYKLTNKEMQNLFNSYNLISRSADVVTEPSHLHKIKIEGNYSNIDREGNRGKSATLLVPGIDTRLYGSPYNPMVGLLHNATETIIRAYMFRDAATGHSLTKKEFENQRANKNKFILELSKESFVEKYRDYMKGKTADYNEILANLSSKSIVGISINNQDEQKILALESKYYSSEKYNYDLPIIIVENGKLDLWNPDIKEIKSLLEKKYGPPWEKQVRPDSLKAGFIIDKNGEVEILNKNEVTTKEVVEFLTENTENTKKVPILMDKLLETVNNRLKNDDLPTIKKLDDYIIHKEDIKNFIKLLEHEQSLENKNYKIKTNEEVDKISQGMIASMQIKRPKKEKLIKKYPQLKDYKSVAEILLDSQPMEKEIMKIKDQLNVNNAKQFFKQPVLQQLQTISRSSGISR